MERKVRIFLVCALGTMAGLAVAWFVPEIVWWIGAIIGGLVSGFLYALPEIKRYALPAAKIAWRTLCYIPKIYFGIRHGIVAFRKASVLNKWRVIAVGILIGAWGSIFVYTGLSEKVVANIGNGLAMLILLVGAFYLYFPSVLLMISFNKTAEKIQKKRAQRAVLFASPIGPLVAASLLIMLIIKIVPVTIGIIADIGRFLWKFVKTLYIFIHSRELVLCTVDGALGVLISYILCVKVLILPLGPTLLVGGLIGGLIGILNYEIVSKRVLRLVLNR